MRSLFFDYALLPSGWHRGVRIEVAGERIASVAANVVMRPGDEHRAIGVPGVANVHSHGFQRGMAGLTEIAGPASDNFWTWREVMYRFVAAMTPEDVEAITALAYVEMLESGFTTVGEFHYLHNDRDGSPYTDRAEMSRRIVAAANATGIGLTLLPAFYAHANFGGLPPADGQRRFVTDLDGFARLFDLARGAVAGAPAGRIGVAPHSLRAVAPDELDSLLRLAPSGPIHMHVAEQVKEVTDCMAWSGKRPVEWLLDRMPLGARWCLIHLTHMTEAETARLAATGAVAGLCPITEADLGDGIFNGTGWIVHGGRYAVGTDSNVLIGLAGEMRQLEYAQRLGQRSRNVLADGVGRSTGESMFSSALSGGAAALGLGDCGLIEGARADIVALAPPHSELGDGHPDRIIDAWIFASAVAVDAVWSGGKSVVRDGRHVDRDRIVRDFNRALRRVMSA